MYIKPAHFFYRILYKISFSVQIYCLKFAQISKKKERRKILGNKFEDFTLDSPNFSLVINNKTNGFVYSCP
jgi:hypothetical protein